MLVVVVSVKGSPGVTTFSVALAARWPAPVQALLIEADPSGGDVETRFSLKSTPGLVSLAAATRRSADPELLWQHAQALPGGLPVVAAPSDADRARAALSALVDPITGAGILRAAANRWETAVIADCGRIDAGSAALPIVRSADAMILLTRAHADDLAHLARRLTSIGRWTPSPAMLLVGDGYSPTEVARELGVPPLGRIPDDPRGAAVLCGRPTLRGRSSGPARSALGQVAYKVAKAVIADQTSLAALPRQGPAESQPMPLGRTVPDVPVNPVSVSALRPAPPFEPNLGTGTPGGGTAS
jgi:hypothetical protein